MCLYFGSNKEHSSSSSSCKMTQVRFFLIILRTFAERSSRPVAFFLPMLVMYLSTCLSEIGLNTKATDTEGTDVSTLPIQKVQM